MFSRNKQRLRLRLRLIRDNLAEYALKRSEGKKVTDILVELGYTCALLDNNDCGLAYTFRNELGNCCSVLGEAGNLMSRPCAELIPWLMEKNPVKAAVGLSVTNAVLNNQLRCQCGNVTDFIELDADDTFGMVGNFVPIRRAAEKKTKKIYVFEMGKERPDETYSDEDIPVYLPECSVVVTATSIMNGTIDRILRACQKAGQVCIIGPSTPLAPEIFGGKNVTALAGIIVADPAMMLRIISEGGGTMQMKPVLRHVIYCL